MSDLLEPAGHPVLEPPTLHRLERLVAFVLRAGVVSSSFVIVSGVLVTLLTSSSRAAARRTVVQLRHGVLHPSGLPTPHTLASVFDGLGKGNGPAIVMFGILLLIVTPIVRVAISTVSMALDHDRRFVLITSVVLCVLVGSFAIAA